MRLVAMRAVMRFLMGLLVFGAGAVAIVAGVLPETAAGWLRDAATGLTGTTGSQVGILVAGIALVLLPTISLTRWYANRRYGRDLTYRTDHGQVSVSLQAVEEALTRAVEQQPSVRRVTVRCREDRMRKALIAEVALALWEDEDVTGQNRRYQDLLRQRLGELLPDQESVQVHLLVHRLSPRRPDQPSVSDPQPDPSPAADEVAEKPTPRSASVPRIALPGLAATAGGVDNRAGAELLRRRRETRDEETATRTPTEAHTTVGTDRHPEPIEPISDEALEPQAEPTVGDDAAGLEDDDPYADLYRGPTYPVPDEDEDGTSAYRNPGV